MRRKEEREAQKRAKDQEKALQAEVRRREAEAIQEQVHTLRKLAEARVEGTVFLDSGSSTSSSEESTEEEEEEDLPGEVEFLRHFKARREHTPDRQELLYQRHGDAQNSISDIIQELDLMETALQEGRVPHGPEVPEVFNIYKQLQDRITHLCYTQGSYARIRGLRRADLLLALDQELKQRSEALLQELGRIKRQQKEQREARRSRRKEKQRTRGVRQERGQLHGDPHPGPRGQSAS